MTFQQAQVDARVLTWDGCVNIRDLGGLATGSATTSFGAILRADSVRKLTDAGWQALLEYGVARIVDLRGHGELAEDPARELTVDVVHVPVLPEFDSEVWTEIDAIADASPDVASSLAAVYLEFLKRWPERFAAALEAIAHAPAGAVVVHCAGGRDRTGLVSALVLRVAGVSIADVAADYGLSEVSLRPAMAEWIEAAPTEAERRERERRSQTPAVAMARVLEAVERRYGNVERYLELGGADAATLQRVRARLMP